MDKMWNESFKGDMLNGQVIFTVRTAAWYGGKVAYWLMAKENKAINKWTIDFPTIQHGEHVLEIGFGSGKAMKYILEQRMRTAYRAGPVRSNGTQVLSQVKQTFD
ncbi:hypothetical protein GCM10009001_11920 [Virgibacillus siamensis]|uniref:tRNA (Guanine-N(7)-)-methyltransferase n=1 Tax=Virgibacillus siamensis TaxID=480071 RepID=A0ABN1FTZ0_9BACI